jgi:hypothetical protein
VSLSVRALTIPIAVAAALAIGATAPQAHGATTAESLYVVQTDGGSLRSSGHGLQLVLDRAVGRVTTFTDRPARVGGTQSLRRFVAGWPATFGADPPNAALVVDRAPASRDVALLELERPRYDARHDRLTFAVRLLRGTHRPMLRDFAARSDARTATRFGRASLFIDDGSDGFGYTVSLNLLGGSTTNDPQSFSLTLDNTQFSGSGQITQPINQFGSFTTPAITTSLSAQTLSFTFPANLQILASVDVQLPSSGTTVTGSVVLPQNYQLQIQSEAGTTTVMQSGPVSFAAPAAP